MRILHLYSSGSRGGGTTFLKDLIHYQISNGHQCSIACRNNTPIQTHLTNTNTHITCLPLWNVLDCYSQYRLQKLIKTQRIQIIHAHSGRDYPIAFLAAKLAGIRCVFTRHYFRINRNPLTQYLFRKVDIVTTVSQALARQLTDTARVSPKKIHVIPNWVPENFFTTPSDSIAPHHVAVIGNINANKGQIEFVKAIKLLGGSQPKTRFSIIGVTDKNRETPYFKKLQLEIHNSSLKNDIQLIPWSDDITTHFKSISILVVPSYQEAFGRIAIEAMATHTAVIASDTGGLAEIVTDTQTGLLFEPSNTAELAKKLDNLLSDNHLYQQLTQTAYSFVKTTYHPSTVLPLYDAVYQLAVKDERTVL